MIEAPRTYVLLLRGINVGGHGRLPMVVLKELLGELGAGEVRTYIQSGNAVFAHVTTASRELAQALEEAIENRQGFRPRALVLPLARLQEAAAANPFPQGTGDPKTLHLYFPATSPRAPRLENLKKLQNPTEEFALLEDVFYLYAPYGISRSRLAGQVESALGEPCTARNWRTVQKLLEMAGDLDQR